MSQTPELVELFERAREAAAASVYSAMPCRVERYDAATQQVDAQPLVKAVHESEEGERVAAQMPVIPSVPVGFLSAGGMRLTLPVQPGDVGMVVFSSAPLDKWLSVGGLVDPEDDGRHSLADAVFYPGLRPFSNPLLDVPTDRLSLGADAGPAAVEVGPLEVRLGKLAVDQAVLGTTYRAAEDILVQALLAWMLATKVVVSAVASSALADPAKAAYATATTAVEVAVGLFLAGSPAYLSQLVKVK